MQNKKHKRLYTTKTVTTLGLLAALSVVIGWVCKSYLTFGPIRITFENIPIIISGIIYGPVIGAIVAVLSDIISCLTSPNPALNPIITLGAASIGIISGVVSKYVIKSGRFSVILKTLLSVFISHIIGSMLIKSIGLHLFWGYEIPMLLWRIPLYLAISVCESMIIFVILRNKSIASMLEKQMDRKG